MSDVNCLRYLNDCVRNQELVELHTHLMGMGNANFWVLKIMEYYIPWKFSEGFPDVFYPLESLLKASGFSYDKSCDFSYSEGCAKLEARMFDGLNVPATKRFITFKGTEGKYVGQKGIYNAALVECLIQEDANSNASPGPLRALVRNWFEFLDSSGQTPSRTDIIDICKQSTVLSHHCSLIYM